jgi:hypothetical protein
MHQRRRWFYLLALPLLWGMVSLLHFQSPGDEYAMWAISSLAGTWALLLAPNVGDIHQWWIRCSVAGTGTLVMFGVGWLLVWLKVRVRIWLAIWFVVTGILFVTSVQSYPSIERAVAKNGSLVTYFLSATLLASYVATLAGIAGGIIKLLYRKFRKNATLVSATKSHSTLSNSPTERRALLGENISPIVPSNTRRSSPLT